MTEQDCFINSLKKHNIISDVKNAESWFKVGGCVKFKLPEYKNSRPTNVKNIGVEIRYECVENSSTLYDYSSYNFVIIFSGYDENNIEYKCSWHLDFERKAKDDTLDEPKVYHPLFHLTYGGQTMKDIYSDLDGKNSDVKKNSIKGDENISYIPLLLIAPRIPFPPMDYFLGIDFVICNFLSKKDYQKLQTETAYKRMIKKSQEKLWKPYFNIMVKNWGKYIDSKSTITPHMLNQMLLR